MSYEVIYKLRPHYQAEPGWWKLKWKPIREGTWNIYRSRVWSTWVLGFWIIQSDTSNGWNRSYKRIDLHLSLFKIDINFWVKFNFIVHEDGPSDVSKEKRRPLDLSKAINRAL